MLLTSCLSLFDPCPTRTGAHPLTADATVLPVGPPAIRLVGKMAGDITAAQWRTVTVVDLVGCVPSARIIALNICIKDCEGKDAGYNAKDATITEAMKTMVANLPSGTPFTITVRVVDGSGKTWDVQPARFVWKG
ncbi:MAG: hypothetical protein ACO1NQ_06230 [Flavobacteriales bacterium]